MRGRHSLSLGKPVGEQEQTQWSVYPLANALEMLHISDTFLGPRTMAVLDTKRGLHFSGVRRKELGYAIFGAGWKLQRFLHASFFHFSGSQPRLCIGKHWELRKALRTESTRKDSRAGVLNILAVDR